MVKWEREFKTGLEDFLMDQCSVTLAVPILALDPHLLCYMSICVLRHSV